MYADAEDCVGGVVGAEEDVGGVEATDDGGVEEGVGEDAEEGVALSAVLQLVQKFAAVAFS